MGYQKNNKQWDGVKRSAFEKKETKDKKGNYFQGWILWKGQFITFEAWPYKNSPTVKTSTGKTWVGLMCKVENHTTLSQSFPDAKWYKDEEKLRVDAWGGFTCSLKGGGKTQNGKYVKGSITKIDKK